MHLRIPYKFEEYLLNLLDEHGPAYALPMSKLTCFPPVTVVEALCAYYSFLGGEEQRANLLIGLRPDGTWLEAPAKECF